MLHGHGDDVEEDGDHHHPREGAFYKDPQSVVVAEVEEHLKMQQRRVSG